MADRSAIVIIIDGLGAAHLGPYGNSWVGTPGFDALAAEALVMESAISDSPSLLSTYRSFWQGRHAMCHESTALPLGRLCVQKRVRPVLVSDTPELLAHPQVDGFIQEAVSYAAAQHLAASPEQTHSAHFTDAVLASLGRLDTPFCLWVHTKGLTGHWDCPFQVRERLLHELDPDPYHDVVPPTLQSSDLDPDLLWSFRVAHAAQVGLIDGCLAVLLEAIEKRFQDDVLLMVTSVRGYPLGEHGMVGNLGPLMHSEQLHVPLLIRGGLAGREPARSLSLCQPADVFGVLDEWFELDARRGATGAGTIGTLAEPTEVSAERAASIDGKRLGFRTQGWFLRTSSADPTEPALYVKPDDRSEINEVESRMSDVAADMQLALDEFRAAAANERLDKLPPLPMSLQVANV